MPNRIFRDTTGSKKINKLSAQQEVLFYRIMMKADDYGNFEADPTMINSLCFPRKEGIRTSDISAWLKEILATGLIRYYEANGDHYLHIVNFGQRLDRAKRKFPEEPKSFHDNDSLADSTELKAESKRSRNRKEVETENEDEGENPPPLSIYKSDHLFKIPELKKKYLGDEILVAAATKSLSLPSEKDVAALIDRFETHLGTEKITEKTESDFRKHFLNWARKQKPESSAGRSTFDEAKAAGSRYKEKRLREISASKELKTGTQ